MIAWLTVTEASQAFGVTPAHIRRLLSTEQIRGRRRGPKLLEVNRRSAEAYFRKEHRPGPKPQRRTNG